MSTLSKLVEELSELEKHATEGPVFVGDDEAEDTISHPVPTQDYQEETMIDHASTELIEKCRRVIEAMKRDGYGHIVWEELLDAYLDLAAQLENTEASYKSADMAHIQERGKLRDELEAAKRECEDWTAMTQRVQEELEAARTYVKDAERYRWLTEMWPLELTRLIHSHHAQGATSSDIHAAIDAALAKENERA